MQIYEMIVCKIIAELNMRISSQILPDKSFGMDELILIRLKLIFGGTYEKYLQIWCNSIEYHD